MKGAKNREEGKGERGPTIDDRLDLGNPHHLIQIDWPEIAHSQRAALESPIFYELLKPAPERGQLAFSGDVRVVDE
jgi:hypothetical protein